MHIYKEDTFVKLYDKIMKLKDLTDTEKIFLCYVAMHDKNNEDKGFCYSNTTFSKITTWDIRKIQRTIDSLKDKKYIIIKRNKLHSPERRIYLYKTSIIEKYEMGYFSDNYILDYKK